MRSFNKYFLKSIVLSIALIFVNNEAIAQQGTLSDNATFPGSFSALSVQGSGAANGSAVSFVKFKLTPNLPTGTTGGDVAKATLTLYVGSLNTSGAINVYRVTSSWTDSDTTAPEYDVANPVVINVPVTAANSYLTIDLTPLVQQWLGTDGLGAGGVPNYGVALAANTVTTSFSFDSKESTTTSHPPQLAIVRNRTANAEIAIDFAGTLAGEVTGTQGATVVKSVGGQNAANVANGTIAANAATDLNTGGAIIKRDVSGNFTAGIITASLNGSAMAVTGNVAASQITGSVALADIARSVNQYSDVTQPVADQSNMGMIILNTTSRAFKFSNGVEWIDIGTTSAAVLTGSITGNQVSSAVAEATHATNAANAEKADLAKSLVRAVQDEDIVLPADGQVYYNTTSNVFKVFDATTSIWKIVDAGSAANFSSSATIGGNQVAGELTNATIAGSAVSGNIAASQISGNLTNATIDGSAVKYNGANIILAQPETNNYYFGPAGNRTSSGYSNTAAGANALVTNTTGYNNTAAGVNALTSNTTGFGNTAIGTDSLKSNMSGRNNTAIGLWAAFSNTAGFNQTAQGAGALYSNTTGYNNTAQGVETLNKNTTGFDNVGIGVHALWANTTGVNNTGIGTDALENNTTGIQNTALGTYSLRLSTTGSNNTAQGFWALHSNASGHDNTATGINALPVIDNGFGNTALGAYAGRNLLSGNSNTFVGYNAGYDNQKPDVVNSMALGMGSYTSKDNQVVIGNNNVTETLLNGRVGIGTTNPDSSLSIQSNTADLLSFFRGGVKVGSVSASNNDFSFVANTKSMKFYVMNGNAYSFGGGNVGVGTESPMERLEVAGNLKLTGTGNGLIFPDGSTQKTAAVSAINSILNQTTQQAGANFNISGNGTVGDTLTTATLTVTGTSSAGSFSGNGAGLTNLDASKISAGTLDNARLDLVPTEKGGTGLSAAGPSGSFLRSDGIIWRSALLSASDIPSGSTNYIQSNPATQQAGVSFNIGGSGTIGSNLQIDGNLNVGGALSLNIVNAAAQYNQGGNRVLRAVDNGSTIGGNLYVGFGAGQNTTPGNPSPNSGTSNTFVGPSAGALNTSGASNTFVGTLAGEKNTTGDFNSYFGVAAGVNSTGSSNSFFGANAGRNNSEGASNTFVGNGAGQSNLTGGSNTMIGAGANVAAPGLTNAMALGFSAQATKSNQVVLGNGSVTETLLMGNVGVGASPTSKLTVGGVVESNSGGFKFPDGSTQTTAASGGTINGVTAGTGLTGGGNSGIVTLHVNQSVVAFQSDLSTEANSRATAETTLQNNINVETSIRTAADSTLQTAVEGKLAKSGDTMNGTLNLPSNGLVVGSTQLVLSGGKVGVGTDTPQTKFQVEGGSVYVGSPGQGIVLKSPNGSVCKLLAIDNTGAMVLSAITCP